MIKHINKVKRMFKRTQVQKLLAVMMFVLLALIILPAEASSAAQVRPQIDVIPIFRPGTILDSIDVDGDGVFDNGVDEFNYVDVQIFIQGNVQFWAVDFECSINRNSLTGYTHDNGGGATPGDPGDDVPMVRWGPDWGTIGTEFTEFLPTPLYNAATGAVSFTASRLGSVAPFGLNGQSYSALVATLRFRVLDLIRDSNSTISCRTTQFLNRDGNLVVRGRVQRAPNLAILAGYEINGAVLYQGSRTHAGISVQCFFDPAGTNVVQPLQQTNARGDFSLPDLREQGLYRCLFYSNFVDGNPLVRSDDFFLAGETFFYLTGDSFTLLPVVLRGGNTATNGGGGEIIDALDLAEITGPGRWDSVPAAPFTAGDANGDRRVNEADLAIVSANWGQQEDISYTHMVYSLGTDYEGDIFPNSRIWWGEPSSGPVYDLVSSRSPDFWGTMSPDGSHVAFSRYNTRTGQFELFTAETRNIPRGRNVQITPRRDFVYDSFAPSWSPDGTRIAFACSQRDTSGGGFPLHDWLTNNTSICVVDADGRNVHVIGSNSRIYPPAWMNNDVVIFAGDDTHPVCPDSLCAFDYTLNQTIKVANELDFGASDIVDMPVIRVYEGTTYLFYRLYRASSARHIIGGGTITYANGVFGGGIPNAVNGVTHVHLAISETPSTPTNIGVDYYAVSPLLDIVFYGRNDYTFYNSRHNNAVPLTWITPAEAHIVDGFVGNPTWDGNLATFTELHGHRATVDWVP